MRMKSFFWLICATMVGLLVAGCGGGGKELPVLRKAPDWVLKDVDGREVKAADFKGKVLVVDFWATWCAPCRKEIPKYVAMLEKYRGRGLVILGFSIDEDGPVGVKKFGQMMKVNYPLIMADGDTAQSFGEFELIPTAFVIDRAGNIRHMKSGPADMAAFEALVESLL
jgi:peroxiredoxin